MLKKLHFSYGKASLIPIENFKWDAQYRLWVYKFENLRAALYWHSKTALQRPKPKSKFFLAQASEQSQELHSGVNYYF